MGFQNSNTDPHKKEGKKHAEGSAKMKPTMYNSSYSSSSDSSSTDASQSSSDGDDDTYQYSEGGTLEANEEGTYEEDATTLDDNTYDDTLDGTLDTNETNHRRPIDWTAEIGNILTEHTTQLRERISGEIDKLTTTDEEGNKRSVIESLPDIGQKVQRQLSHVLSPLSMGKEKCETPFKCTQDADKRVDEDESILRNVNFTFGRDNKENSQEGDGMVAQKVQSILKSPQTSRFPQNQTTLVPPRLEMIPDDSMPGDVTVSGSLGTSSQQMFQADWSQCSLESETEKVARELKEAKAEIETLRNELKEVSKQKQNAESQLEFAKLALESLSHSHSGSFSQIEKGNMPSLCQTLEISDGAVGIRAPKKLMKRSRILRKRR